MKYILMEGKAPKKSMGEPMAIPPVYPRNTPMYP
jgi:hypothetical protein